MTNAAERRYDAAMATGARPRRERRVDKHAVEDGLGRRLRERREQEGLSLRELARRLGISASAISQFETGKSRLSVSTLYAIVTELGMSLDELFSGLRSDEPPGGADLPEAAARRPRSRGAAQDGRHVRRAQARRAIDLETGVRWEQLTPNSDPDADFLYVVYDVGGSSCQDDRFIRHSGREYGLVLEGTLEVTVGFDRYELGPGDSICFDSTVPHCLRNVGTIPVRGVWFVVGRQSDPRSAAFGPGGGEPGR
jgi:transcriptional regulator with XRE-family HTH domain